MFGKRKESNSSPNTSPISIGKSVVFEYGNRLVVSPEVWKLWCQMCTHFILPSPPLGMLHCHENVAFTMFLDFLPCCWTFFKEKIKFIKTDNFNKFWAKNLIFEKKIKFWQKFQFSTKIWFWEKIQILIKNSIFERKFDFSQKNSTFQPKFDFE